MSEAPGKNYREGISLVELFDMFPDNETARKWFEGQMWPDGPVCPHCGTHNVQCDINHKTMTHRCRECDDKPMFSVKKGSIMEGSNIPYRKWAIAVYLFTTSLKGVSSMKLHRDLKISQKSAWYMLHRIREVYGTDNPLYDGPVEVDETYMGGKRKNMSNKKRKALKDTGRGAVGKTAVVGMKDRETNEVTATVVNSTDADTLQGFVTENTEETATVYTDDARAYNGIERPHESVRHSVSEYVRDQAHTNGIESFWAMLKRGYIGTYHHMSKKHLNRYVGEFAGRHNDRQSDTVNQMSNLAKGMVGKQLTYKELVS